MFLKILHDYFEILNEYFSTHDILKEGAVFLTVFACGILFIFALVCCGIISSAFFIGFSKRVQRFPCDEFAFSSYLCINLND